MKSIEISQATGSLDQYVRELDDGPLVFTKDGQPFAVLMPIDDEDLDTIAVLGTNPKFQAVIAQARAQRRAGAGLSTEEARRALGLL